MIDTTCPQCGSTYHSDRAHVGRRIRCIRCGYLILIIDTQSAISTVEAKSVEIRKATVDTTFVSKIKNEIRPRWLIWGGSFAIVLVALSIWAIRFASREDAEKPEHKIPVVRVKQPERDIFDELADEQADRSAVTKTDDSLSNRSVPQLDTRPSHYNSLPTGTRIISDVRTSGHGKLRISNRTDLDAVVRLYDASTLETIRWFSVQAYSRCSVSAIPPGAYTLAYTSGLDWRDAEDGFRWHPSYHEFERSLTYSERKNEEGVEYHELSVTLHPVVGGNVRTKEVSRETFLRGHRHMSLQKSKSEPAF